MRPRFALCAALALAVLGCAEDGDAHERAATTSAVVARDAVVFVELRDDDWSRRQAIWPQAWSPGMATVEPSIDWWAEYERGRPSAGAVESVDLRISGHHVALDTHVAELERFDTHDVTIAAGRAVIATGPDGGPATVSIAVRPDYTVMALSYALGTAELTDVAAALETISQAAWLSAGGRIVACAPPTPDCPPPTT